MNPMKIGTIECFAGISGDMLLGALIDAGVPAEILQKAAVALGIGAELRISLVDRGGIRATKVDVLENGVLAEKPHVGDSAAAGSDGHHHHDPTSIQMKERSRTFTAVIGPRFAV